jgi:hypothetical protein
MRRNHRRDRLVTTPSGTEWTTPTLPTSSRRNNEKAVTEAERRIRQPETSHGFLEHSALAKQLHRQA